MEFEVLGNYGNTSDEEWEEDNIEELVTTDNGTDPHSIFITVCCVLVFIGSLLQSITLLCLGAGVRHRQLNRPLHEQSPTTLWIFIQIAISNLIFALTLPFWLAVYNENWVMGKVSCKVLTGMYFFGLYGCIYFQTFAAVAMSICICFKRKCLYSCCSLVIIWVGIAIPSILEVLVSDLVHVGGRVHCILAYHEYLPQYAAHYVKITVFFFIPLVVITLSYVFACIIIYRSRSDDRPSNMTWIVIASVIQIVLLFIFWAPYNIFLILHSMTEHGLMSTESFQKVANRWTLTVCHTLPFFYGYFSLLSQFILHVVYSWRQICERLGLGVEPRPDEVLESFRRSRTAHRARTISQRQSVEPRPHEGSDPTHQQEREYLNPNFQMQELNHELQDQEESPDPSHLEQEV